MSNIFAIFENIKMIGHNYRQIYFVHQIRNVTTVHLFGIEPPPLN